jgi:NAD(P)H-flavin reductase/hemoglobin-like flavoprotein
MVDVQRLKDNFAKVAASGDEVPLFFYSHLFLCHPETRNMFPVSMMQQRDRLVSALGRIVSDVDNLEALVPFLEQLGRDHRKFGTMGEHYPAVGSSLLATLRHFSGDEWTEDLAADWAAAYGLVAKTMSEAANAAAGAPAWWEAKIVAHEQRTFDIAVIRIQPEVPIDYQPGQSVSIESERRPRLWRYYSIANAPRSDGTLDLHVQLIDGGPVSSVLVRHLDVGDLLRLGPPVGQLTLDPASDRDLLMVAGSTGVAPLKALIEQVARQDAPRRVHLFFGARTPRGLYDIDDLEQLARRHPWLTVTPAVSDDETYDGEQGLVSDVVVRHGPWLRWDAYVCGSPHMVAATTSRLIEAQVPEERIRFEEWSSSWPGPEVERSPIP